jgi:transcriptional regulator with XRE-family HTH domain
MTMIREHMTTTQKAAGHPRPQHADRYVGARLREYRIMLGMTQQQLARLIGITCQQEHKYEKGINRIGAGRLYQIARVLGVDIGYFYEGLQSERRFVPTTLQRMLLELSRNFLKISKQEHREVLADLARALAEPHEGAMAA